MKVFYSRKIIVVVAVLLVVAVFYKLTLPDHKVDYNTEISTFDKDIF